MLIYTEDPDGPLAEIDLDGTVTREEFEDLAARFEAFVARHGTVRLVEIVRRVDLRGVTAGMLWEGLKTDARVLPHIERIAVVGDQGWLGPLSRAAGAVMSPMVRSFPLAELEAARDWARA